MTIKIKELHNDRCSNCNAIGEGSELWEVSISRSNTIQGSTLYYRLCMSCVEEMNNILTKIKDGDCIG